MKTVLLLLMAMLAIKTTSAQGQEVCSKSYVSCVDKCVVKPSQSLQESCIQSCQKENNSCAGKALGGENLSSAKPVPADEPMSPEVQAAANPPGKPAGKPTAKSTAKQAAPQKPARQMAAPAKPAERRAQ